MSPVLVEQDEPVALKWTQNEITLCAMAPFD